MNKTTTTTKTPTPTKTTKSKYTKKQLAALLRAPHATTVSPSRKYRAVRVNKDVDVNRLYAWELSYFNDRVGGWLTLRNYDMRINLKEFAVDSKRDVFETTYKELFNYRFQKTVS